MPNRAISWEHILLQPAQALRNLPCRPGITVLTRQNISPSFYGRRASAPRAIFLASQVCSLEPLLTRSPILAAIGRRRPCSRELVLERLFSSRP